MTHTAILQLAEEQKSHYGRLVDCG